MRYAPNQTIKLDPEHEEQLTEEDELDMACKPVEIEIKQNIHSTDRPFLTYWEVEYLDSTPNKQRGESVIMTENMISNYEVPETEMERTSQEETYGLLAEPSSR